jgi:DNA-binding transcriptional regulator LsrR (DeoR family)
VVQMTGAAGVHDISEESAEIVQRLAAVSGGTACPIYAPLVLDTAETAAALRRQPHVAEALSRFDQLTIAVMAVGTWDPPNSRLRSSLTEQEREALQRQGVAAEVCASLVDAEGRVLAGDYLARTIAVRPEQLQRIPEVIAVAGGPTKVAALRALLAAGFVTSVVTDAAAARSLLAGRTAEAPEATWDGLPLPRGS